jgi:hypothetical protein
MQSESRIHYLPGFGDGTPGGVRAGKPTKENWLRKVTPRHPNYSIQRMRLAAPLISAVRPLFHCPVAVGAPTSCNSSGRTPKFVAADPGESVSTQPQRCRGSYFRLHFQILYSPIRLKSFFRSLTQNRDISVKRFPDPTVCASPRAMPHSWKEICWCNPSTSLWW